MNSDWQPIETATQATEFAIGTWWTGDLREVGEIMQEWDVWYAAATNQRVYPTHWMPLPEPPPIYTPLPDDLDAIVDWETSQGMTPPMVLSHVGALWASPGATTARVQMFGALIAASKLEQPTEKLAVLANMRATLDAHHRPGEILARDVLPNGDDGRESHWRPIAFLRWVKPSTLTEADLIVP